MTSLITTTGLLLSLKRFNQSVTTTDSKNKGFFMDAKKDQRSSIKLCGLLGSSTNVLENVGNKHDEARM